MTKQDVRELFWEFMRYGLVGGLAFLIDTGTLIACKELLFSAQGETGTYIATAIGFITGLIFNYIFSIIFVFKNGKEKVKGKQAQSFLIFAVIGAIGLILTELGMLLGITLIGDANYIAIKVVVAALVLFWNYIARKATIFKK